MQELNELKNLVIQSLESNGSLSNIRAQIRASVFKVIDNSEAQPKKESPYNWENQKCGDVLESEEGRMLLMLIKEFLQFYKMEYSLSVFSSEATLREEVNREVLSEQCNINTNNQEKPKPLLWQLLQERLSGKAAPEQQQQQQQQDEDDDEVDPKQSLKEAQELIKKNQESVQQGKIGELQVSAEKEEIINNSSAQYGQIQENISYDEQQLNMEQPMQSSDVIGASQSQGYDMSVDSLALEDYDYFEEVEDAGEGNNDLI